MGVLICTDYPVGLQLIEVGQAFPEARALVIRQTLDASIGKARLERANPEISWRGRFVAVGEH